MSKKIVYFLRAGNGYGYGYGADEVGKIDEKDFADLQKRQVVRVASPEEVEAFEAKRGLEPTPAGKGGKEPGKAGKKAGKQAEAKPEGAEADPEKPEADPEE